MSKNEAILSFNSGELSPKIDQRIDVEKYRAGCRRLENMIPTKYGGAEKRPGFKYIDTSNANNDPVRMLPFIYSSTIAYKIEVGDYYFRFYYGDAVLLNDFDEEVIISTPYSEDDIFQLHFEQIADVMRIVHPSYHPMMLTRTSATSFCLYKIPFEDGPYFTRNDLIDIDNDNPITMTSNVTAVDPREVVYYENQPVTYDFELVYAYDNSITGTLTASDDWFLAGHVGALFKLYHPRTTKSVTLSGSGNTSALNGRGTYSLITRGTWTGTIVWQRRENGGSWEELFSYKSSTSAYQNISKSYEEEYDSMEHRLYSADASAALQADFSIDEPLESGTVQITSVASTTSAGIKVIDTLASTDATRRWSEGAWSDVSGYPASVTFFEDRCIYAGDTGRVAL